jgi:hypothetical protein
MNAAFKKHKNNYLFILSLITTQQNSKNQSTTTTTSSSSPITSGYPSAVNFSYNSIPADDQGNFFS